MTSGTLSVLTIGAIASFGLGVLVGPHLTGDSRERADVSQQAAVEPLPSIEAATPATRPTAPRVTPAVPATSADLQARLRPVLYQGTNMDIAAEGFRDSRPTIDAAAQADLAVAQARVDIATIKG